MGLPLMHTFYAAHSLCPAPPQLRLEYQQGHIWHLGNNVPYLGRELHDAQNSLQWYSVNGQSRDRYHDSLFIWGMSLRGTESIFPYLGCPSLVPVQCGS